MTPSHLSTRDHLLTAVAHPYGPTGAEPIHLAHLVELMAHWLTVGAVVASVGTALVYALMCAAWPYRTCPRCQGYCRLVPVRRGRARRAFGVVRPGHCRRCHGTGLRLRLGRRAWNHYSRFRHARRIDRRRRWHNADRPGTHTF